MRDKEAVKQDRKYREWVQKQPSCLSGNYSEYINGEGRCIAAHVRTAANAGVGMKPLFSCVPLTNDEHQLQHKIGYEGLKPMRWWLSQVSAHVAGWKVL